MAQRSVWPGTTTSFHASKHVVPRRPATRVTRVKRVTRVTSRPLHQWHAVAYAVIYEAIFSCMHNMRNFMVVHTHQIHPYTLHRFTAQVAMSVWPLVNHIHKRVSFDRKDFGPPHMCFPRWKVPELVGKVENMLPECQSLGKSAQKL